jgi:uncharacterized damage-inducible protein DinB
MERPQYPAGPYVTEETIESHRDELIAVLESAPAALADTVAGLTDEQLATRYRNWSIRQIVHHIADSHVNSYVRFKWTLTEDVPTIKAYDEGRWAALADSEGGDIQPALWLLAGLHARWVQLLRSLTDAQFARTFRHPETGQLVRLDAALSYYAWHGRHHTAQIAWLRQQQ